MSLHRAQVITTDPLKVCLHGSTTPTAAINLGSYTPQPGDNVVVEQFGRSVLVYGTIAGHDWLDLTLSAGISPGPDYPPQARREGDLIYLSGSVIPTSGTIANNTVIATVPDDFAPAENANCPGLCNRAAGLACQVNIKPTGDILVFITTGASAINLDSIVYRLI